MTGGIAGGSLVQGVLTVGDKVEIRPGVINMVNGERVIQPLIATVESLRSDTDELSYAVPGGLIGVGLSIYAGLTNDDRLKGQVMGHIGTLPDMYDRIEGRYRQVESRDLPEVGSRLNVIVNGVMNVEASVSKIRPSKKDGRGDISLSLLSPVVIDMENENETRLAIMWNNKLVASLTVKTASLSLPVHYPEDADLSWKARPYELVNDMDQLKANTLPEIKTLIEKINSLKGKAKKDPLPVPNITIINTCSLISTKEWSALIAAITHESNHANKVDVKQLLLDNLGKQLQNTAPRFNGEGNLVLNGRIKQSRLKQFLRDYENKILTCPSCGSTASVIYRDRSGVNTRHCTVCKIETYLTSLNMTQLMEVKA
jgi:translation initiation factor 2 beta subunit (eIF-2beta)/eIF-5